MTVYQFNDFLPNSAKTAINILWESDYFPINKILSQKLGIIKAIILAEMLLVYEDMENEVDNFQNKYILFHPYKLCKELGLNIVIINTHIKLLEKLNIISVKKVEFKPIKYYKINFDKLLEILSK